MRVAIAPTGTALPVVVADKQGFFKAQGLKVTFQVSNVSISDQLATLGRQFDVAMGTQPALITAAAHRIALANITGGAIDSKANPQTDFVASAASGITSYAELEGKNLGALSLTGNIHYAVLNAAKQAGAPLDKANWVVGTVPQLPDTLRAGRADGIEEIEPFASMTVANGGVSLGSPFRSLGDEAFLGIFLASKGWADANEETVLKFNTALAQAADWITANQADALELMGTYTGASKAVLAKTRIPDYRFQTTAADLASVQGADTETWIELLREFGNFKGRVSPADVLPGWAK
ncbi:ABC transporter substrate-binding protein [Nocardia sp. NPDC049220]|uniref:ABC transporter substrate-binding protein n=1 Tax=Nocardia sp. NPDC049220 TaxID=3155273 RepID=UPI0033DAF129